MISECVVNMFYTHVESYSYCDASIYIQHKQIRLRARLYDTIVNNLNTQNKESSKPIETSEQTQQTKQTKQTYNTQNKRKKHNKQNQKRSNQN